MNQYKKYKPAKHCLDCPKIIRAWNKTGLCNTCYHKRLYIIRLSKNSIKKKPTNHCPMCGRKNVFKRAIACDYCKKIVRRALK